MLGKAFIYGQTGIPEIEKIKQKSDSVDGMDKKEVSIGDHTGSTVAFKRENSQDPKKQNALWNAQFIPERIIAQIQERKRQNAQVNGG